MPASRKSPLALVPPPFYYVLAFLAGIAADHWLPWRPAWFQALAWAGWALVVVGVAIGPGSALAFLLKRTTLIPGSRPTRLVTGGAYRLSRNPMYLGLALLYVGLAVVLGPAWPLVFLPIPLLAMNLVFIPMEEANARQAFGEDYLAYCRKVRRWL
jgi:protein-S-isoprenylcysteine O-methyltransferase Ste14